MSKDDLRMTGTMPLSDHTLLPENWDSIDVDVPVTIGFGGVAVGRAHVTRENDSSLKVEMSISPEHAGYLADMFTGYIPTSLSFAGIPAEIRPKEGFPKVKIPCHRCGPGYNVGDEGCRHGLEETK